MAWKARQQRSHGATAELSKADRAALDAGQQNRLADMINRLCMPLLKGVISHKVRVLTMGGMRSCP